MIPEPIRTARDLLSQPDHTVSSIARLLGGSRARTMRPAVALG
jgi:hypothetical protein